MKTRRVFGAATAVYLVMVFLMVGGFFTNSAFAENTGKELVKNGGAEIDASWTSYNCGSDALPKLNERTSTDTHSGGYSRHIVFPVIVGQSYPMVSTPPFTSETAKTYQIRFWYKIIKGTFGVQMRNGADNNYVTFAAEVFSPNYINPGGANQILIWKEFVGSYTEKNGGPNAAVRFFGGSESEFYIDDFSVMEVDVSKENILRSWQKLFPGRNYLCWNKSPWDNLAKGELPPASIKECKEINLALGGNEYESASFVLTNFSEKTADFAVSVKDAGIPVTIREALWVTTNSGKEVNDALPLLEGNLSIPSGESREVWLTLYTKGIKAGDYNPQIMITSQGLPSSSVNLKAKVYPVSLPDDKPLYISYWEYLVPEWTTPEVAQALTDDMKQHYVNTPVFHPYPLRIQLDAEGKLKKDYTELDGVLNYYLQLKPKMILINVLAEIYLEKMPGFFSEEWKSLFKSYITGLVSHLKEKGFGYDKFALYPYDERIDQPAYNMAKLIKEIDPNILVYVNNTGTKAQAKAIAPYTDIWCPFLYDYLNMGVYGPSPEKNTDPKILSKKPDFFWTYANPLSGSPQESSPYGDYRLAVWRAWQAGMSGFGYWIYSYKTNWNSYKLGENWAVVYFANAKDAPPGLSQKELVVTGKRWEATREGVEDYVYLRMLKDALEKAGGKVPAGLLAEAKKVLAESPQTVLSDLKNTSLADKAKERILGIIARLAGSV